VVEVTAMSICCPMACMHVASVHAGDSDEFKPEYSSPALAGLGHCSLRAGEPRVLEGSVMPIVYQCKDSAKA
jgi:hypothetical protein